MKLKRKSESTHKKIRNYLRRYFGVKMRSADLYECALTHRSVYHGKPGLDNERLEFLGDRILDAIVAHYLYETYPGESEGELTRRKSQMVNRVVLAAMAMRSGLDKMLIYSANREINLETLSGNALEALIGAIYLEKGYQKTYKTITGKFLPLLLDDELVSAQKDYKSELMIYAQKRKDKLIFSMEAIDQKVGNVHFEVSVALNGVLLGKATASSRKKAEQAASKQALTKLTAESL